MGHLKILGLGLFTAAIGALLHVIGSAFTEWETNDIFEKGIFEICNKKNDSCSTLDDLSVEDRVVQGLAITGIVASMLGIFEAAGIIILSLTSPTMQLRLYYFLSAFLCLLGFASSGGCVVLWSLEIFDDDKYDLDTSFYMSAVGSGLLAFAGLFILTAAMRMPVKNS